MPAMTQERALDILKTGANVFLTGAPGAGKSYVINQYTDWLEVAGIPVAITASTGIAATHIGGVTIHSWSAIGTRDDLTERDLDTILGKEYVVKRLKKSHVLIIDEISMLSADTLDMVDVVLQRARGSREAFGGVQVVMVGDFFQLPPITKGVGEIQYAFSARAWRQADPLVCYISDQYRHEDELLSGILQAIRSDSVEESHYTLLGEQTDIGYEDIEPTRLFTHNAAVDELNLQELKRLPGNKKQYTMKRTGNKLLTEGLVRSCLSPEQLVLCEDAMVMCTKNNFEAGYANGTLGRIIGFDRETNLPRILTAGGTEVLVKPTTWSIVDHGKTIAEIEQLPLRLAWAITVHKSQGMSLDAAEVDLSRAFVYGQGYVALSRVRTLTGLKVSGMNPNALSIDPQIITQDQQLQALAEAADSHFTELSGSEIEKLQRAFVSSRGKQWPTYVPTSKSRITRHKPLSTYEETRQLLTQHASLSALAKARQLTTGTIVSHLEHLANEKQIDRQTVEQLLPPEHTWSEAKVAIFSAFDEHGTEKLKPVYDALDGAYDYLYLRLARLLYI